MFGLIVGIGLGLAARGLMSIGPGWDAGIRWFNREAVEPFGQIFLRMLFFVVVPLVFSSLALGVVQLGRLDRLGPLAVRTFGMFGLNMAVGVGLGLLMMNLLAPGTRIAPEARDQLLAQYAGAVETIQNRAAGQETLSFRVMVEMFMPRNLLKSVVDFQLLPLILFALLVGAGGTRLAERHQAGMAAVLQVVMEVMTDIVHYALQLAPYAVAALVGSVVIVAGAQVLRPLIWFVTGVMVVMGLHLFGTMTVFLRLFSRRSPRLFFRAVRSVLITAFSTSSSSATLPTSIQVSQEVLKVSPSTAGFVLPLGATMNMSGTALYEGCVVLFVAQVYKVDLSLGSQVTLLILAVLSAVAVAGIPGASLPVLVGLLASFHLPAEGIALILGFDRLLDMARTAVNVGADLVTACVVDDRMQGALGRDPESERA